MSNWDWVELNEVGKIVTGSTPSTKDSSNYGDYIPFVKPPQLNASYISEAPQALSEKGAKKARILPPNSVMVSCIGNLGMVAVNKCKMATNQQINSIIPNEDLDYKFLFYQVQSSNFRNQLDELSSATTVTIVNKGNFSKAKIAVPPLPTQHRIVEKIEEVFSDLDNGIKNLKKARQQLKTYKQSVLKAAFEGKLTQEWREQQDDLSTPEELKKQIEEERKKYREQQLEEWKKQGEPRRKPRKPRKPKQIEPNEEDLDSAPNTPNNWIFNALDSLSNIVSGYAFKSGDFQEEGVPVIKIANVGYSQFKKDGQEYLDKDYLEKFSKYVITENDLLIALTRPITNNTTKTCFYPHSFPSLLNQRVGAIKEPIIKNKWILYYFQSIHFQNYMRANFTETLQPNLSITDLRLCPIPIPCFKEQKEIINSIEEKLSILEQNLKTIDGQLQKAEALRQSILKKAFEGRLVDQVEESQTSEKSISKFQQMQMIGHLIEVLQKNYRMQFGELALIKYMYLIDRVYKYRTGFKFKKHNHGPYDPNFKELLYTRSNFFTRKDPGYFKVTPTKRDQLLNKKLFTTKVFEEAVNSISKFTKKFYPKGIAGEKLELLTTVCKIIEDYHSVDLKNIREVMADWEIKDEKYDTKAEKFTEDETERCLDFVTKKGWDSILINS